jgi:hypothetical protein
VTETQVHGPQIRLAMLIARAKLTFSIMCHLRTVSLLDGERLLRVRLRLTCKWLVRSLSANRRHVSEAIIPEGPSYILRDFPTDYRLYDHNKGNAADPRHDMYLYGGFS